MLAGTKKLLSDEYDDFIDLMIEAAENNGLPVTISIKEDIDVSMQDLRDIMYDFYRDTSLEMTATVFLCNECGRLHTILKVDYSDEEPQLIQ